MTNKKRIAKKAQGVRFSITIWILILFIALAFGFIVYSHILKAASTSQKSQSNSNIEVRHGNKMENKVNSNDWFSGVIQSHFKKTKFNTESIDTKTETSKSSEKFRSESIKPQLIDSASNQHNNSSKFNGKLYTVTYASHGGRDDRFCRAVESSIRNEYDLVILGWNIPWRGLSQKLEAAHSFASSLRSDDIILFTDAFDVLFTGSKENILQNFLQMNTKILFSAECGCWPHVMEDRDACFHKYPPSPTPYRYLNSGTYIGYATNVVTMLQDVIKKAGNNFQNANDQKLVADMYIAKQHGITLDFHNKIFQSMHMTLEKPLPYCNPSQDIIFDHQKRYYNKLTQSYPSVFHFNGGGKAFHLKMENQAWYKTKEHNSESKLIDLGNHELIVPSQSEQKLKFKQLCGNYLVTLLHQYDKQ
jgi:glycosyltransferase involved in cell wall biosynthesis